MIFKFKISVRKGGAMSISKYGFNRKLQKRLVNITKKDSPAEA